MAADAYAAPGYPSAQGTPAVREAIADWFQQVRGVPSIGVEQVLPTGGRARARELGAVVVSDECDAVTNGAGGAAAPSVLDEAVIGRDPSGLLVSYSVSKHSNLAGHRLGLAAGDPQLIELLVAVRRDLGLIVPSPDQALLADAEHVEAQRERYAVRRTVLREALRGAGLRLAFTATDEDVALAAARIAAS